MKILVLQSTIIGGVDYQPSLQYQTVPDHIGQHMIEIGNATPYETKIVEVAEKKSVKAEISSASQPDPALPERTVKKRRGRPPKSSS